MVELFLQYIYAVLVVGGLAVDPDVVAQSHLDQNYRAARTDASSADSTPETPPEPRRGRYLGFGEDIYNGF